MLAGSLWAAWRGHVAGAAVLAAGAGLLRPNGLMLALPLLLLLPAGRARLAALAPVLGAAGFGLYLWAFSGDPLAFVGGQANHHPLAVGRPLARLLSLDPVQAVGLGFLLLAVASAAWLWTRRAPGASPARSPSSPCWPHRWPAAAWPPSAATPWSPSPCTGSCSGCRRLCCWRSGCRPRSPTRCWPAPGG